MILNLMNVSKSYKSNTNSVDVLEDLTFEVSAGETVAILGPSGCGKTTTLNLAAGFIRPDNGRVVFNGQEVGAPGPDRVMIFQEDAVLPWLTVEANVRYAINTSKKLFRKQSESLVNEFLELVGLKDRRNSFPKELSGGMRKRLEIARAFVIAPKLVLADEPFAKIDAITKERLQERLLSLSQKLDTTMLFATHDIEEAVYLSDRVLIMSSPPKATIIRETEISLLRPRRPELKVDEEFQRIVSDLKHHLPTLETG